MQLQSSLPLARVVYSSATSATGKSPSAVGGDGDHDGSEGAARKDERPVADRIAIRAALLGDLVRQHSSSAALVVGCFGMLWCCCGLLWKLNQ